MHTHINMHIYTCIHTYIHRDKSEEMEASGICDYDYEAHIYIHTYIYAYIHRDKSEEMEASGTCDYDYEAHVCAVIKNLLTTLDQRKIHTYIYIYIHTYIRTYTYMRCDQEPTDYFGSA